MPQTCVWTVKVDQTLPMNHIDMEHKWCKNGPKTPQNYVVHSMLVPVVSYFISYPAFKCLPSYAPNMCVDGDR